MASFAVMVRRFQHGNFNQFTRFKRIVKLCGHGGRNAFFADLVKRLHRIRHAAEPLRVVCL